MKYESHENKGVIPCVLKGLGDLVKNVDTVVLLMQVQIHDYSYLVS